MLRHSTCGAELVQITKHFDHQRFRSLRVINEDIIAPGKGFGTHPHRDMEIISYVIDGALEHRDSMGNGAVLQPGEIQRMSAGRGITHSEFNPSAVDATHLLQIWIHTAQQGIEPDYEQASYIEQQRPNEWCALVSPREGEAVVRVNQDVALLNANLASGRTLRYATRSDRHQWLQLVAGSVVVNGETLQAGDGAAISEAPTLVVEADSDSELLLFDLA